MPIPANWRWLWEDPVLATSWRMPRNPAAMTSPIKVHQTEGMGRLQDTRAIARRVQDAPLEWHFSGPINSTAFETTLLDWLGRDNLLFITDHFGRRWEVKILAHSIIERRIGNRGRYKANYDVTALVLGEG